MTAATVLPPLTVTLQPWEAWQAIDVGNARQLNSRAAGWTHRGFNGNPTHYQDEFGAGAELAVARWANVYWPAGIGTHKAVADVGTATEVRTTDRHNGGLILRGGDPVERVYVLVVHDAWPVFHLRGWLWGTEIMRAEWRRPGTDGGNPWWLAPQSALRPMERGCVR